jgi:ketosteroid isomerase-like protein
VHANAELIARFYDAFARRDAEAMAGCYHADIEFSDPVFTELRGDRAGNIFAIPAGPPAR